MIGAWGTTRLCFFTDQIKREAPSMDAACGAAVDTITSRYGCVSKFHISTNEYRDRIRRYHVQQFYDIYIYIIYVDLCLKWGNTPQLWPLSNASPDAGDKFKKSIPRYETPSFCGPKKLTSSRTKPWLSLKGGLGKGWHLARVLRDSGGPQNWKTCCSLPQNSAIWTDHMNSLLLKFKWWYNWYNT